MRDMTTSQFNAACVRRGFKPLPFLGYFALPSGTHVSVLYAAPSRRARLAYLISCEVKEQCERQEAECLGLSIAAYKMQRVVQKRKAVAE